MLFPIRENHQAYTQGLRMKAAGEAAGDNKLLFRYRIASDRLAVHPAKEL
jgi:hypothetical protein